MPRHPTRLRPHQRRRTSTSRLLHSLRAAVAADESLLCAGGDLCDCAGVSWG